jgi:outer membrane protein assembly factor BamA
MMRTSFHLFTTFITIAILTVAFLPVSGQQIDVRDLDIDTTNQIDLIDIAKSKFRFSPKKTKRYNKKKVYFSLLPTSSTVPGAGKALITSTKAGFYLGDRRNTFLSDVSFSPYLNFKGRYAIAFRSNLYTSRNLWNIQGDTRFSVFPEYIYGTENTNNSGERLLISYKYIRFYHTVLKKVKPYFLAGIGYNLDYHAGITTVEQPIEISKFTGYNYGTGINNNSLSSGVTFNLLYDTRNNAINPLPGAYGNIIFRLNPSFLGNSNPWKSLYLDARRYRSLDGGDKRKLIAFWSYVWTALDNDVPYLDLPAIGAEPYQRSGRGIEINRYRGKSLVYFETEYRSDITKNGLLGFVVFTNVNTNTGAGNNSFTGLHPAAGAGLRIKFNKRSNTNIAIDYGISKGNSGVTINLGEAF